MRIRRTAGCACLLFALAACGSSSPASKGTLAPTTAAPTTAPPTTPASGTGSATPGAQAIVVTPRAGLHDGDTVHVVATGFTPSQSLILVECADKGAATGQDDCNVDNSKFVTPDAKGKVVSDLRVVVGPFGGNKIVCSAKHPCLVSVAQPTAQPAEEASVDISFG